jgi:hypothetical protein
MNNTKLEFQKRASEIETYFNALAFLDKGNCSIVCTDILGNKDTKIIDNQLSIILKANGFLLLYNLIEATVRNSISAIFNSIHSTNATFKDLTDELQKLWISQEIKQMKQDDLLSFSKKILEDELLTFKAECVNISGNIDARKIREIAKQFGYQEPKNGRDLLTIKEKRNKLAHGEYTFVEIGKDYTVQELLKFKDATKDYLSIVLSEIENFINSKGFSTKYTI